MKKIFTKNILAITTLMLLGVNKVNAQALCKSNNGSYAFLNQLHVAMQPNYLSNNSASSLGKKVPKFMLDSFSVKPWDTISNTFLASNIAFKANYDVNGNCTLTLVSAFNPSNNQWLAVIKTEYSYNANNKLSMQLNYNWDFIKNQWIYQNNQIAKTEYFYDNKGNNIRTNAYEWDTTAKNWTVNTSTTNIFNSNNKITSQLDSNFYGGNTSIKKGDYTYDGKGNITLILNRAWNNSTWSNSRKNEYTFDANNNNTLNIDYNWDNQNSQWVGFRKNESTFDTNGNNTTEIQSEYANNTWNYLRKNNTSYNNSVNFSDIAWLAVNPVYSINTPKHQITGSIDQEFTNNKWINYSSSTYYYKAFSPNSSALEIELIASNIYPNPTTGIINITTSKNLEAIHVFDISGKMVHSQTIATKQNNVELNLSSLNNGIYFIHALSENGESNCNKIVITK